MFSRILNWIREVIKKMIGQTDVKRALNVDVALNAEMNDALQLWTLMYVNKAPWLVNGIKSLNLAAAIAGELSNATTIELKVEVSGSARANYLSEQFQQRIMPKLREQIEFGAAKGGLVMKPYIDGENIAVDFVQADQFYPVAFDEDGDITSCIFADQRTVGDKYYTRLEYHNMTDGGYQIKNMAFRSSTKDTLGQQVPLTEILAWADLTPEAMIMGVERPLFAYFRFPLANNIDPTSPLGVSCFSRAVDLIKEADVQWSNLLWEFESGQRALYVDVSAFDKDSNGKPILPHRRLFRTLHSMNAAEIGEEGFFHEWSPTLREKNILNGLDAILKRIEYTCGLAYGTLSDPQSIDKTATEIKTSKQRTYATITSIQNALRKSLDHLLYVMDVWATLGNLAPRGSYSTAFEFDDSVIVDKDAQFQQDLRLVTSRLMGRVEFRMRNLGEDEATAKAKIAEIDAEGRSMDFFDANE